MQKKDEFMQISITAETPLEKRITVTVPAGSVEEEVTQRLRQKARSARLPGFRPGRVPMAVVERQFGADVLMEAFDHLINETYFHALQEQSLRPVGRPEIQVDSGGRGQDLIYTAIIEVYPDFAPQVPAGAVTRQSAEVAESDVDATIEIMRQQRRHFVSVDRAAQEGDRVLLDFSGSMDGEPLPGGSAQDYPAILGGGRLLPELEGALTGLRAGAEKDVEITFPEDYHQKEFAGKTAQFHLLIKDVAEPQLPEIDAAFALSLGIEDGEVETLRREVRENLEREARRISEMRLKTQVLELLIQGNTPDLPRRLIAQEVERLQKEAKEAGTQVPDNAEELARRRVTLGLVMSEIARREQLRAERQEVAKVIEEIAEQYEDPEEVMTWYRRNPEQLGEAEAMALEAKVVAWVLERVTVTDEPVSFNQLIGREPVGAVNA
uniref:Trigger factor n=2 Tax=Acidithiobacillus sulfuriphilus TaxID=1867749 RepID=A0A3M8QT48_9PROT|nr:trigger factor [Acidithiobacillus sulfuriphilus]